MMEASGRMRLGRYEFAVESATFRYISQSWSGPGWDFNIRGRCLNDDPIEPMYPHGGIGVYTEAAPLPFEKAVDYTGVELDLPGGCDEATGEPYFAIDVGESYEVSDVRLRFAGRDGDRYLIEMSGTAPSSLLGRPERLDLRAWVQERPDHAYPA
ncbi:hypothetical protein [Paludisphaera mucosa]|uniref:DUF1579 domain-containing protein n=1 Tax=Paludisphaera mucosa TaxID=3030827 RepID=A0ABT6FKW1_9BACT|nr:hypothetical protein [Paludisphaera mucosa]MDG3008180.1 hypothetical protein [Paludisphaera mucosa]